jgi:hypothetical protein
MAALQCRGIKTQTTLKKLNSDLGKVRQPGTAGL